MILFFGDSVIPAPRSPRRFKTEIIYPTAKFRILSKEHTAVINRVPSLQKKSSRFICILTTAALSLMELIIRLQRQDSHLKQQLT